MIVGKPQFARRAQHAETFDAAHLGPLDLNAGQLCANPRTRNLHAGSNIRCTTHDLQRTGFADIDRAELELVGIRMFLDAQHFGDDDIRKVDAGRTAFLDFEAGHGQDMTELLT